MKSKTIIYAALPLSLMLALAACGGESEQNKADQTAPAAVGKAGGEAHADEGKITLTADQIASAGIQTARPVIGGSARSNCPQLSMATRKARRSFPQRSVAESCR